MRDGHRLIIYAYPKKMVSVELMAWGETEFGWDNIVVINRPHVICARNSSILDQVLAAPQRYHSFVFADADVRPNWESNAFLDLDEDIAGCRHAQHNPKAFSRPDSFHTALFRVRRPVFEIVKPPWFWHNFNEQGTQILDCECNYFRDKCLAAGLRIAHCGWANHDCEGSWHANESVS